MLQNLTRKYWTGTSGCQDESPDFTVDLDGAKTVGVVRCDQPGILDLAARKAKKLESVQADVTDEVLAKLATLIS